MHFDDQFVDYLVHKIVYLAENFDNSQIPLDFIKRELMSLRKTILENMEED